MSPIHDDPTEEIPAICDEPTQQVPCLPGYLWADQEDDEKENKAKQGRSLQEPCHSVLAWPPVIVFLVVFVIYVMLGWYGIAHANEVLYVLVVEWQWGH